MLKKNIYFKFFFIILSFFIIIYLYKKNNSRNYRNIINYDIIPSYKKLQKKNISMKIL
jgi:hypothetical protein